jgi:hypothetical protein
MIEDILHSKQFEGEGDNENVIGRIAALNHMKSSPKIDPPSEKELPKQCPTELPEVTERAVPFLGQWVPVDMDPLKTLVSCHLTFALGRQYGDLVSVLVQRACFLPYPGIERNWIVFDNYEDFFLHNWDLVA